MPMLSNFPIDRIQKNDFAVNQRNRITTEIAHKKR